MAKQRKWHKDIPPLAMEIKKSVDPITANTISMQNRLCWVEEAEGFIKKWKRLVKADLARHRMSDPPLVKDD